MTENKDNMLIPGEIIMNQIYCIRGHKVMLDEDLAELYQVTTGNLNKAVITLSVSLVISCFA